jgi:hypothetical protein
MKRREARRLLTSEGLWGYTDAAHIARFHKRN